MGRYRDVDVTGKDPALLADLHRFMVRLRRCEEALFEEYHPADEMRCPVHFCIGQESIPAALSQAVGPDDYLFSHHRTHGYYLAKHAPMKALFAEIYGKETGANGGKAGSQDISMSSVNFFSGAILSGATAIAVGAALGFQMRGEPHVAVAGFGEGASDEGVFWEAVNYAALKKLPMVFVCENNRYATYSDQLKRQPKDNIGEKVQAFGCDSQAIFGNDVVAAHTAVSQAVELARSGKGPQMIEAYTFRWNGHVGPEDDDVNGYRTDEERQLWRDNCPILLLEEQLYDRGLLTADGKNAMVAEIDAEIAEAFDFAKNSPFPHSADWPELNLGSATPMADKLLQDVESRPFDQNQAITIPGPY
jgi:TPP-dependent pyruvate/acetoin dehydrogenase alpha subunit